MCCDTYEDHGKMLLEEATDKRKTQINSAITYLRVKAQEKHKEIEQMNQPRMEVQVQPGEVKTQVQPDECRPNYCNHRSKEMKCF